MKCVNSSLHVQGPGALLPLSGRPLLLTTASFPALRGITRDLLVSSSSVTNFFLFFFEEKTGETWKDNKKYQLDWLPFWSSQGLGPRNPIWEGRREEEGEEGEKRDEVRKRRKKEGKISVTTQCKMCRGVFEQDCVTFSTFFSQMAHVCVTFHAGCVVLNQIFRPQQPISTSY